MRNCKELEQLHLENTSVTDAGLRHLQAMNKMTWLVLNHTEVSDAGLIHLQGLTRPLVRIDLFGTKVSREGVDTLQAALPRATINCDLSVNNPNE